MTDPGMDDSRLPLDPAVDESAFVAWLDGAAEAEGTSRAEFLESIVSSYWTLVEIADIIDDEELAAELSPSAGGPDGRPPAGGPTRSSEEDVVESLTDRYGDLSGLGTTSDAEHESVDPGAFASLRERVEGLEADLADARERPVGTELDDLDARVDAVEAATDARIEELESWLAEEFGDLRTIIEYLIEHAETVDGAVDELDERLTGELDRRKRRADRLVAITEAAAALGVDRADCAGCGEPVDVALLSTPACPQCRAPLDGVEPKRGWFGSPTLTTREGAPTEIRFVQRSPGGGFAWGEDRR